MRKFRKMGVNDGFKVNTQTDLVPVIATTIKTHEENLKQKQLDRKNAKKEAERGKAQNSPSKSDSRRHSSSTQYKHGYTVTPAAIVADGNAPFDVRTSWQLSRAQMNIHDHRVFTMVRSERPSSEHAYNEYEQADSSETSYCRPHAAALILMSILLLRQAISIARYAGEGDARRYFMLLVLRTAVFLLPCYIMANLMSTIQRCRQRQASFVLCRLFEKSGPGPKNGEQHEASFREKEWIEDGNEEGLALLTTIADNMQASAVKTISEGRVSVEEEDASLRKETLVDDPLDHDEIQQICEKYSNLV